MRLESAEGCSCGKIVEIDRPRV